VPFFFSQLPAASCLLGRGGPAIRLLLLCTFVRGLVCPQPHPHPHSPQKPPFPPPFPLLAAMPVASWPICCASPALVPRPGHHTAQHNQAQPQPRQPPTSFSFRQKPSKGGVCYMLHSNTRQVVRTKTTTKQERHNLHGCRSFCCFSFFCLFPSSSCPAGTWHFRLRLCPHAPSLLLTHTAHSKNTGAGENEPTTSQVPSYDVRTRTHLAGGRRPAYFINARDERTSSFTAAEARPARRGTGSRRQRKATTQGARCDEPTKGTNHRAAGLSSSAPLPAVASCSRPAAIGHYSLSTVKSLKNLRRRA